MQIWFRIQPNREFRDEYKAACLYFPTVSYREDLIAADNVDDNTVMARYSMLPLPLESTVSVESKGLKLLNGASENFYVANMEWYEKLAPYTFETWFDTTNLPEGSYVVKGRTNSKKFQWNTEMYAENRLQALMIAADLQDDSLIGNQGIAIREYVPLETFEIGLNGLPFTNEWRYFFLDGKLVDFGYYWSIAEESNKPSHNPDDNGTALATECANLIKDDVRFVAIDVAKGQDGKWWLVEVNDGQMSGLSDIPAHRFYQNLKRVYDEG